MVAHPHVLLIASIKGKQSVGGPFFPQFESISFTRTNARGILQQQQRRKVYDLHFFLSLLLPPHTTCDAFMLILCAAAAAGAQEPLRKARKKGNLKTLVATWLFMFVYLPVLLWQKENSCQLWMDFVLFFKTKETRHCVRVKRRVKQL